MKAEFQTTNDWQTNFNNERRTRRKTMTNTCIDISPLGLGDANPIEQSSGSHAGGSPNNGDRFDGRYVAVVHDNTHLPEEVGAAQLTQTASYQTTPGAAVEAVNTNPAIIRVPCVRTVAELIEESRKRPLRWLIDGVLLEEGIHILHGKEESFKTMLTLQMHAALAQGGQFLMRDVEGGRRTGIVELEEKPILFGHRLERFFRNSAPLIHVLPDDLRREVLYGATPKQRIAVIAKWARQEELEVVSIDSAVKLFPPTHNLSKPEQASEVEANAAISLPAAVGGGRRDRSPGCSGAAQDGPLPTEEDVQCGVGEPT